ncbi:MAG: glycosyltransferase family 2 protein [Methylovulum sp.]|uniref:glycosyltransferase family 2 protein n=1 Tax=Methylovulum sp. TaxID=1916980 RepID=UPI00262D3FCC|nr:glycosyltransferase family 2 protein [Methylovulum sp.]MDD2725029.1 glycosyltransferase family 2 protein [Methylovulum sp.]MDD5125423.1 glycosyltransferase family 2 protein [Methylovulum sp.]
MQNFSNGLIKYQKILKGVRNASQLFIAKSISFMTKTIFNIPETLNRAHELKRNNKIEEAIALLEEVNLNVEHDSVIRVLIWFLMDTLNYKRVAELPHAQKYDAASYVIAKGFLDGNLSSEDPICLEGHQVLDNVAFISMVKDEEDIIFYNLLWHYALGLRKFFLIDNLSTDRTLEYIKLFERLFEDSQVFILHDPVVAHYQGKKVTGACRFAMSLWDNLEWLVLTDADEFLCPKQPLHKIFDGIPKTIDAIVASKSFYNLVDGDSVEEDDLFFRRIGHRTPVTHTSSKVIMRANLQFNVSQGNHHIFAQDGKEISNYTSSLDLTYREFRMRSYPHHKKKVMNGGVAIAAAKQQGFMQVGGEHWEAVYNLYLKEGDVGLRRHLQNCINNSSRQTSIYDPLPLDKVIEKMDASKKISFLIGKD